MGRLLGLTAREVQANRAKAVRACLYLAPAVVVLKGAGTLVGDGQRLYENKTGNPGMATGGTGDVLTGLIAALSGQRLEPFAAACLSVYLHGLAGDLACQGLEMWSLIAGDLIAELPNAIKAMQSAE
jgi:NAD(P)H-hydrate epimerase